MTAQKTAAAGVASDEDERIIMSAQEALSHAAWSHAHIDRLIALARKGATPADGEDIPTEQPAIGLGYDRKTPTEAATPTPADVAKHKKSAGNT